MSVYLISFYFDRMLSYFSLTICSLILCIHVAVARGYMVAICLNAAVYRTFMNNCSLSGIAIATHHYMLSTYILYIIIKKQI